MSFAPGHAKAGGRKKGARNRRTVAAEPKVRPDGLDYLVAVMTSTDGTVTPDLKLRAAIALSQYQHPKPIPLRETLVSPIDYMSPKTIEEARRAILELGERLAKGELPIELHDALVNGIKAYLGDRAVEQEKILARLEGSLRGGDT